MLKKIAVSCLFCISAQVFAEQNLITPEKIHSCFQEPQKTLKLNKKQYLFYHYPKDHCQIVFVFKKDTLKQSLTTDLNGAVLAEQSCQKQKWHCLYH